jgi:hypothetical protein
MALIRRNKSKKEQAVEAAKKKAKDPLFRRVSLAVGAAGAAIAALFAAKRMHGHGSEPA